MGIRIENLSKSFGEKLVLSGISCELPEKGLVKVIGASGKGKTTLLRIIAGLDRDYTGTVDGVGRVSYLFQEHRLFPWLSALDNVLVAAFEHHDQNAKNSAVKLLSALGLSDTDIALKPSKLSGGMKQRVAIARALLRESDVLILDEPTKELDPALVEAVTALIGEAAKSRLVILASHDAAVDTLAAICEISVS